MPNPIGPLTKRYLTRLGYEDRHMNAWTEETRLLHDIGLLGDNVLDEFEIMRLEYEVDFSEFDFKKYFPSELSNEAFLINAFGWTKFGRRIKDKYPPITLRMIEAVLAAKKWVHD